MRSASTSRTGWTLSCCPCFCSPTRTADRNMLTSSDVTFFITINWQRSPATVLTAGNSSFMQHSFTIIQFILLQSDQAGNQNCMSLCLHVRNVEFGKRSFNYLAPTVLPLNISDFHLLSAPSNAVWKLTFSNSTSTLVPCCPPNDCQCLWFNIITQLARVINACIIIIIIILKKNNNLIIKCFSARVQSYNALSCPIPAIQSIAVFDSNIQLC